jgi:hypothetical protein
MVCNFTLLEILKQDSNNTNRFYLLTTEIVPREFISEIQNTKVDNNLNFTTLQWKFFLNFPEKKHGFPF